MKSPDSPSTPLGPWTSLWVVALLSLVAQLWMCQFFSFGERIPVSIDVNPSNLWRQAYHFPPDGTFQVLNWLGIAYFPQALNPLSLAAAFLSPWWFFTTYTPVMATLALLAMAVFLREFELSRPASLFGAVLYAWQGDLLPFIYPGHYAYITTWAFFAIGAWAALRSQRTRHWAYALISGACCGIVVGAQPDRGGIISLFIAALYLAPAFQRRSACRTPADHIANLRDIVLCVVVAACIALAPLLALFKGNISGVKLAGTDNREQTYRLVTEYSLCPTETLTYLVPGLFGWHTNHPSGPYWGWIGEWPDWPKNHQGPRNLNLAISTTGTVATVLGLLGVCLLTGLIAGGETFSARQLYFGRLMLALGLVTLILSWGWHTGFYRPLFALPLMDKWRDPLKWLEMTNFALVVLSALGVQYLLGSLDASAPGIALLRRRLARFTLGALIVLALGFVAGFPLTIVLTTMLQAQGFVPESIPAMMSTMHVALFCAVAVMALACIVLRLLWRPEKMRTVKMVNPLLQTAWDRSLQAEHLPLTLALSLAALVVLQMAWVASQFIEPVPVDSMTASNPMLEALRSEGNTVRCAVPSDDPLLKGSLLQNQFTGMGISCLDISAASRIPDDLNTFFETLADNEERLWFLAGVKNVAVPQNALEQMRQDPSIAANIDHADGYTLEPTPSPNLPSHALIGMKNFLAKATFVPDLEIFSSSDALLKRLKDPKWDPRATILLEKPATIAVPPAAGPATPTDSVILEKYTPSEIDLDVHASRSGFVLVNDQYDPDWQVQLNGQAVPLLRADDILRAIAVPAGASKITMRYVTHYRLAGLSVPAVTIHLFSDAIMLAAWLLAARALRRET